MRAAERVAYACPQCRMLVHLDVRHRPLATGAVVADTDTLVRALAIHMRFCEG